MGVLQHYKLVGGVSPACRTSNDAISPVWWRPGRAERRKRASALSVDFTPEGAQAFFDYHQQQKEKEHERSARQAEAAERARVVAAVAWQSGDDRAVDLDPRRRRGAEHEDRHADRTAEEARGVREGHGRGDDEAGGADHRRDGEAGGATALVRRRRDVPRSPAGGSWSALASPGPATGSSRPSAGLRVSRRRGRAAGCRSGPTGARGDHASRGQVRAVCAAAATTGH